MTHKTLKEAYESVGLIIDTTDILKHPTQHALNGDVHFTNGWFFRFVAHDIYAYDGREIFCIDGLIITRAGKQVYPPLKKEKSSRDIKYECMHYWSINSIITAIDCIEELIDAKIREAK